MRLSKNLKQRYIIFALIILAITIFGIGGYALYRAPLINLDSQKQLSESSHSKFLPNGTLLNSPSLSASATTTGLDTSSNSAGEVGIASSSGQSLSTPDIQQTHKTVFSKVSQDVPLKHKLPSLNPVGLIKT